MKRFLCMFLALIMTAALFACGSNPSGNLPEGGTSGAKQTGESGSNDGTGSDDETGGHEGTAVPSGDLKAAGEAKVGDVITFGSWDQDGKSGGEPISWIVLCQGVGKTFVLSEKILEYQCFQNGTEADQYPQALYRDSDLRKFLNGEFYNGAFTDDEKAAIPTVKITTAYKDEKFFERTYETEDKVFPLSRDEEARYVCGVGTNIFGYPTERVLEENPYILSSISNVPGVEKAAAWWLRDMGTENAKKAAYVYASATQKRNYDKAVYEKSGVRPAMWIVHNAEELEAYEKGELQPKADEELDNAIAALKTGYKLKFGKYDKNSYNMDGYEDLYWTVISEDSDSFLLVSDDQIGSMEFTMKDSDGNRPEETSWAESDLRKYLNGDVLMDLMFSPQEKSKLLLSHVVSSGDGDRNGGSEPDDYIFIPDINDYEKYLSSDGMGISYKYWLRTQKSGKPYMGFVYANGTVSSADPTGTCYVRIMARIKK